MQGFSAYWCTIFNFDMSVCSYVAQKNSITDERIFVRLVECDAV